MPRGGNGQEFRKPLDEAQKGGFQRKRGVHVWKPCRSGRLNCESAGVEKRARLLYSHGPVLTTLRLSTARHRAAPFFELSCGRNPSGPMPAFHHFALCPHSRFIRLVMGELQMEADPVETSPFCREHDFLAMNPAGLLPVLVEHDGQVVAGPDILSEYLDETRGLVLGDRRLLPEHPSERVEVRRLLHWFNAKFFHEVSELVLNEKAYKRVFPEAFPGMRRTPTPSVRPRRISAITCNMWRISWRGGTGLPAIG